MRIDNDALLKKLRFYGDGFVVNKHQIYPVGYEPSERNFAIAIGANSIPIGYTSCSNDISFKNNVDLNEILNEDNIEIIVRRKNIKQNELKEIPELESIIKQISKYHNPDSYSYARISSLISNIHNNLTLEIENFKLNPSEYLLEYINSNIDALNDIIKLYSRHPTEDITDDVNFVKKIAEKMK